MMARKLKTWKEWKLTVTDGVVARLSTGEVYVAKHSKIVAVILTPSEARRLFQKLSGDYRD
jgi:hypothetical protein